MKKITAVALNNDGQFEQKIKFYSKINEQVHTYNSRHCIYPHGEYYILQAQSTTTQTEQARTYNSRHL